VIGFAYLCSALEGATGMLQLLRTGLGQQLD
jgi:hypothetical protein